MNATTMLEVPCFGIGAWLVWKLARYLIGKLFELGQLAIKTWATGDDERTKAIAKGFADITGELKNHGERLGRIEKAIDVRGIVEDAIDEAKTGAHAAIPEHVDGDLSPPIPISGKTPPAGVAVARAAKGGS